MRPYASTAFGSGTSSASIEDPVIVPASERIPNRSGTGSTLIGSSPPAPATISWPRGASPPSSGDMDLLFAAVARIEDQDYVILIGSAGPLVYRRTETWRFAVAQSQHLISVEEYLEGER